MQCPECAKPLSHIEYGEVKCKPVEDRNSASGMSIISERNDKLVHTDGTFCKIEGPAAGVRF